jgi:hypothetical protein
MQSPTRLLQDTSGDYSGLRTPDSGQRGEANIRGPDVVDQAIRTAFDEQPFSSVRKTVKKTCISTTPVWWRLTNSIGFVMKYLCWSLTNWTMQNWQQGYRCRTNSWQSSFQLNTKGRNILSLVMSRGLFINRLRNHLVAGWQTTPEMEKHMIQAIKMIVTVAWIHVDFTLSKSFQKENQLMQSTTSNRFYNQFLNCIRNPFGFISSFMQTMPDPI